MRKMDTDVARHLEVVVATNHVLRETSELDQVLVVPNEWCGPQQADQSRS